MRRRLRRRRAEGGAETMGAGHAVGVGLGVGRSTTFEEKPILRRHSFDQLTQSFCSLVAVQPLETSRMSTRMKIGGCVRWMLLIHRVKGKWVSLR